jgi:hypothetical protein
MAFFDAKSKQEFQIYNGLTEPSEFFRQFNIYAMLYEWNDGKQVACLKLFVKGKAEEAYNAAQAANKTTIAEYIKYISEACQLTKEQRLRLFYSRKMKDGENIRDYAQALNGLIKKAIPNVDKADLSALVQGQLIANVPVELKPMLTMASSMGSTQFEKVIDTMTSKNDRLIDDLGLNVKQEPSELNYTQANNNSNNKYNNGNGRNATNYTNNYGARSSGYNDGGINNNSGNQVQKEVQFDGRCFKCNEFGHRIAFCPGNQNNNRNRSGGGSVVYGNNSNNRGRGGGNNYGNNPRYDHFTKSYLEGQKIS